MSCVPLMLPFLDASLLKSSPSATLFDPVCPSSLVVQMEFSTHDPTLLAVVETFMNVKDVVNHRMHLVRVNREEGGEGGIEVEVSL